MDYDRKQAIFHMRHLPSEALLEKELGKRIVDRYWAGMLAGGASWIFGEDVDATETRCVADGKESCEFVLERNAMILQLSPFSALPLAELH